MPRIKKGKKEASVRGCQILNKTNQKIIAKKDGITVGKYYNCQLQGSYYKAAQVTNLRRNNQSDRYEYNVQLYKCPRNLRKWIPKSNINNKELTQDELKKVCHRTAEDIERNQRSKVIKKQSSIWNLSVSESEIEQYLDEEMGIYKPNETEEFKINKIQEMNQKIQNEVLERS